MSGFLMAIVFPTPCFAGPPYVTDDPEPAQLGETELYLFSTGAVQHGTLDEADSGIEANYGVIPDVQLSAAALFSHGAAAAVPTIALGIKYRFVHETAWAPQASVYPAVEFRADGKTLFLLPVWFQKDFGAWSAFGGGGIEINTTRGSRSSWTGGIAVSRRLRDSLTVGAELYGETAEFVGETGTTGLRVGTTLELNDHFALLGSAGPEFDGSLTRFAYYLALSWRG